MHRPLLLVSAAVVLTAFGCGRLGFEPADDGGIDGSTEVGPPDGAVDGPTDSALGADVGPEDSALPADSDVVAPLGLSLEGCATEIAVGTLYECRPLVRDLLPEETLTWSFGPEASCEWLELSATTGLVAGTPSTVDEGTCVLHLAVSSSRGPEESTGIFLGVVSSSTVRQVDIGAWHSCALSATGAVRCWGMNTLGQLGYDDTVNVGNGTAGRSIAEMGDVDVGGPVRQISLAYMQSCALMETGGVRCWGNGSFGRLGYAHTNDVGSGGAGGTIVENGDLSLGGSAAQVVAGGVGGCARMSAGGVRCWGMNHGNGAEPQLGGAEIAAAGNLDIGAEVLDIAGGYDHYCAIVTGGYVRCWGQNYFGALGYDDTVTVGDGTTGRGIADMGNVDVGGRVVQLSAGDQTTCAVLDGGGLRCWGWNDYGQLGYGDTGNVGDGTAGRSIVEMGDVPVGGPVAMAWAGEQHTCAVLTTGTVRCWGFNAEGQLGYDDTLNVGDGTVGRAIVDMGDVALGDAARYVVTTDWDSGFTCAHMLSGGLRCWGNNDSGQLGIGDTLNVGDGAPGRSILDFAPIEPF